MGVGRIDGQIGSIVVSVVRAHDHHRKLLMFGIELAEIYPFEQIRDWLI